jgi:predicted permease
MNLIPRIFSRRKLCNDLEEEMRLHMEERAEQLMREGMSRSDAERQARVAFGNRTVIEERSREVWQWPTLESIWADVRFALRQLRRSPGFAFAAVLTLALAIGANAVVFSMLNALVLHPGNVPHTESLYAIERGPDQAVNHSYPDYVDLRDRNRSFESLAAYNLFGAGLDTGKNPSGISGFEVSGNYFDALEIQPYLGRFFHDVDEHGSNSAPYIVLSYAYWHTQFQDDRGVVGRVVRLNKHPYTILGVAPREFQGTLLFISPDLWVPMVNTQQLDGEDVLNARGHRDILMVLGHLKAGVTPVQAISDLNSIGSSLEKSYPKDDVNMTFTLARSGLAGSFLDRPVRAFLAGLMLLAALILLAACANLGSLFAARAADRSREVALRLALGSSRKRILRQVFTEAMLISLIGGGVGLFGSVVLLRQLSAWEPLPQAHNLHIPVNPDVRVYAMALLLALVSGFLFGAVPVRQVFRTNPYEVVKSGSVGRFGRWIGFRDILLVVQISICALLVTSSLVAVRGLVRSLHSNFGFDPSNTTLVRTLLSMSGYSGDGVPTMQRRMIESLQTIPGVQSVGLISWPPLTGGWVNVNVFNDQATDLRSSNAAAAPYIYNISPDYFRAAGTALLAGRAFSWHDDKNSPRVAVVNREFAVKLFGSTTNAVGRRYKMADGVRVEVVGIVEDGKYVTVAEDQQPAMFVPFLQEPSSVTSLVVRTDPGSKIAPQQLPAAIRSKMLDLEAGLPFETQPWRTGMDAAFFASHVASVALGVLGIMGAMLAVTGIFGMAAYSVSRRMRELGIRIALGAQRREVLLAALSRPLKLLAFGSAVGLILGLLATRVLAHIVYQATPRDPLVLTGVVLAMLFLGLLATWIPAQRALSVDPMKLLREE